MHIFLVDDNFPMMHKDALDALRARSRTISHYGGRRRMSTIMMRCGSLRPPFTRSTILHLRISFVICAHCQLAGQAVIRKLYVRSCPKNTSLGVLRAFSHYVHDYSLWNNSFQILRGSDK